MSWEHELTLYLLLGTFGISLLLPGLTGMFKPSTGLVWLVAEETDARSHLRGLNAMMAALGALALFACIDLVRFRLLVIAIGVVLTFLVVARIHSLIVDGLPGPATRLYLAVEVVMAAVFLLWPPVSGS